MIAFLHSKKIARFTLIELMIAVTLIGILAVVAVPAFIRYIRESKTSEATEQLKSMGEGAVAFYNTERDSGVTKEYPTGDDCGGNFDRLNPDGAQTPITSFVNQPWTDIKFTVSKPFYYRYCYSSGAAGDAFRASANASLENYDSGVFHHILCGEPTQDDQATRRVSSIAKIEVQGRVDDDGTPQHTSPRVVAVRDGHTGEVIECDEELAGFDADLFLGRKPKYNYLHFLEERGAEVTGQFISWLGGSEVTPEQVRALRRKMSSAETTDAIFDALDANGDGVLSVAEITNCRVWELVRELRHMLFSDEELENSPVIADDSELVALIKKLCQALQATLNRVNRFVGEEGPDPDSFGVTREELHGHLRDRGIAALEGTDAEF